MSDFEPCCHVNLVEPREVIQYFRDLANVGHMLQWNVEAVRLDFCKKLQLAGWDDKHVSDFQRWAWSTSIWEENIPKKIPSLNNSTHPRILKSAY